MSEKLRQAQAVVADHMDAILRQFLPGAKITVLVRSPNGEERTGSRDFVMTDDDLDEVAAMIERRRSAGADLQSTGQISISPQRSEETS